MFTRERLQQINDRQLGKMVEEIAFHAPGEVADILRTHGGPAVGGGWVEYLWHCDRSANLGYLTRVAVMPGMTVASTAALRA